MDPTNPKAAVRLSRLAPAHPTVVNFTGGRQPPGGHPQIMSLWWCALCMSGWKAFYSRWRPTRPSNHPSLQPFTYIYTTHYIHSLDGFHTCKGLGVWTRASRSLSWKYKQKSLKLSKRNWDITSHRAKHLKGIKWMNWFNYRAKNTIQSVSDKLFIVVDEGPFFGL